MMKWLRSVIEWIKNLFAKKTMRRKISLYIGDQLVDLDDQSFILFNYTMDDLSNPAIVKNSFSQQITLKGTPNNNRVFGDAFKTDRRVDNGGGNTGVNFNASQKTPFTIYNEMDEILESGYVKLDSVSRKGADIQYKVTLYGGLGSFFYALSYDENGNKRSLADLIYLNTSNPDTELDFVINAASIQDAWDDLSELYYGADPAPTGKWTIINFAPAYNGYPDNFSPDKGILSLPGAGLPDSLNGYSSKNGYGLVNLANPQDEWAVKDIRSYLQRPVLSMRAFLDAICRPENNGGYEVDITQITNPYLDLWLTLPTIPSLGTNKQESGDLTLSMSSTPSSGNEIGRYDIVGSVPAGTQVTANLNCKIRFNTPSGANSYNELSLRASRSAGRNYHQKFSVIFIQAVAYGSDNSVVGGSTIKCIGAVGRSGGASMAAACGYVPVWSADYENVSASTANKVSAGVFEFPNEMGFSVTAQDAAYYKIIMSVYSGTYYEVSGSTGTRRYTYSGDGLISTPVLYHDYDTGFTPNSTFIIQGATQDSITYTSSDSLRSGATITKFMLLSSSNTPADYLLSICKMFGLYFVMDTATRKVTILNRNHLYQDETIDLSHRVDLSKGVSIQPLVFNSKWYDFILEGVGGAFYDEYLNIEGIEYGIQRVNTGYDFNADSVNLMDSVVFKNACAILARSRYWNIIMSGATFIPSPFLDSGNTITRWNASDETQDTPISCPSSSAVVTYYNTTFRGYDIQNQCKVQFADADGKMVDGKDVLLFLNGFRTYDKFKITDDLPVMGVVNGDKPCWILDEGNGVDLPIFSRYEYEWRFDAQVMTHSLDFGVPRQMDIPGIVYDPSTTIYVAAWKKYISDKYDDDSKVMICRVDFAGIKVSQDLLRKFYWYDNSLWVLNKIKNYSLTTFDPVECEFVQVQDKGNYLNGQEY